MNIWKNVIYMSSAPSQGKKFLLIGDTKNKKNKLLEFQI